MVRVKILKSILAGEVPGQIRQMSLAVARIRAAIGSVEIVEEATTTEAALPAVEAAAMAAPKGRRRIAR